jgi:hypothetical protein
MPFDAKLAALSATGDTPNQKVSSFMAFAVDMLKKRVKPAISEKEWAQLMSDLDFGRQMYLEGSEIYPLGNFPS